MCFKLFDISRSKVALHKHVQPILTNEKSLSNRLRFKKGGKTMKMNLKVKSNKRISLLVLTLCMVLGMALPTAGWSKADINLKLGTYFATTDIRYGQAQYFANQIAEKSNGKVNIVIYPGEQLAKAKDAVNAVAGGAIDMYLPWSAHYAGTFPIFDLVCQPFVYPTFEKANQAMTEITVLLDEDFQKHGVKVPFAYVGGTINIFSESKFYKKPSDLKGEKIAGVGGAVDKMFKSFGAGVVSITSPERYLALQRKIVNATITTNATYWSSRLYEVSPFATVVDNPFPAHFLIVNIDKCKSFPKGIQDTILNFGADMQAFSAKSFKEFDQKMYEDLLKMKGTIHKVSANDTTLYKDQLLKIMEDEFKARGELGQKAMQIVRKYSSY